MSKALLVYQQIALPIEDLVRRGNFIRKPLNYLEVTTTLKTTRQSIQNLEVYKETDLSLPPNTQSDYLVQVPNIHLHQDQEGNLYLVETQGYNYPRYMTKIEIID